MWGWFRRKSDDDDDDKSDKRPEKEKELKRKQVFEDARKRQQLQLQKQQQQLEQQRKLKEQKKQRQEKEEKAGRGIPFLGGSQDESTGKEKEEEKFKPGIPFFGGGDNKEEAIDKEEEKAQKGGLPFFGGGKEKSKTDANKKEPENDKSPTGYFSAAQKLITGVFSGGGQKEEWVPVVPKTRLSPGEIVPATIGGIDLLVIASRDGRKLYCIANSCPHLGTPLETGQLVRLPIEDNSGSSSSSSSSETAVTAAAAGKPEDNNNSSSSNRIKFTEMEVTNFLSQDGCEDCIVCPLHRTAFALESGQVRGEWCPYPPILGKLVGTVKSPTSVAVFGIRTRGKNIEVRINTPLVEEEGDSKKKND